MTDMVIKMYKGRFPAPGAAAERLGQAIFGDL